MVTTSPSGKTTFLPSPSPEINLNRANSNQHSSHIYVSPSLFPPPGAPVTSAPLRTKLSIIEIPPGAETTGNTPTGSIAVFLVVSGKVEVELDGGEKEILSSGDNLIHHNKAGVVLRNRSQEVWVRMASVGVEGADKITTDTAEMRWGKAGECQVEAVRK